MKVIDIIKKIDDVKLYIEIIDAQSEASYGFYSKNEIKQSKHINKNIAKITTQYYNGKRLLVIYTK